jgi:hypothetical protein
MYGDSTVPDDRCIIYRCGDDDSVVSGNYDADSDADSDDKDN